jgi:hypothetical protein
MFDIHQPKEWCFGHYYVDKQLEWDRTLFTCVAELGTYELRIDNKDEKDDGQETPKRV